MTALECAFPGPDTTVNEEPKPSLLNEDVLECLRDGVLLLDSGRIQAATGRAAQLIGLPKTKLLGASASDLLPPELHDAILRLNEGASSVTLRGLNWDGPGPLGKVTLCLTEGPSDGQLVVQLRDDSDPSGQAAAEGFRRRIAWIDSLAAGIAHEIRNPLGGIRGAAQLLRRKPDEAETDELTQLIVLESDRIDSMVEQLMELTRPRKLQRSEVDINRLVHDEVALLSAQFGTVDVGWNLDLDPSLPEIEGDGLRLREAIGNLLRNAREAARTQVTVRSRIKAGGRLMEDGFDRGRCLHLDILDDGPGVSEEQAPSIFAPFASNKPDGTGLGLFVTRQIADSHGAQLTLDSSFRDGACFRLVLAERLMPGQPGDEVLPESFHFGRSMSPSNLAMESTR